MKDSKMRLREHIEKTIDLTDDEFEFIQSHFSIKKFKKHQFLVQEGESVKYAYFVVSGLLKLVHTDVSGKQHIIAFAMEDWWETDFHAFITQGKATLSLECLENTEVLCILLEDYNKLCSTMQKAATFFLIKANSGHIASQRRIISLLTSNAKERYEDFLRLYPALVQRVPKTHLATFLGVSRETLSRLSS
jgi:CRP-like cAMP-binding protein